MSEQIYFTKEITKCENIYNYLQRWTSRKKNKSYDPNEDIQQERYCPRCDNKHTHNCNLTQIIIEFEEPNIQSNTICSVSFIDNINIPLWNRDVEQESGYIRSTSSWSAHVNLTKENKEKYYNEQVFPIDTSTYRYNNGVSVSNFNMKLFADSFADDELESFRCNVEKFTNIFDNIYIDKHLIEIKYLLLTEYKGKYIGKQDFLSKHKPNLYETIINYVTKNMNKIIVYKKLSSKSNSIPFIIISKLITLYMDFQINPLFDATNFDDKKPNPHIGKKQKNNK
jgi:hypothetical protein